METVAFIISFTTLGALVALSFVFKAVVRDIFDRLDHSAVSQRANFSCLEEAQADLCDAQLNTLELIIRTGIKDEAEQEEQLKLLDNLRLFNQ